MNPILNKVIEADTRRSSLFDIHPTCSQRDRGNSIISLSNVPSTAIKGKVSYFR